MDAKQAAAYHAMNYVQPGMIVGLGTGSTAFWAIQKAGEMVRGGFDLKAIATSEETEKIAGELRIPLLNFDGSQVPDIDIDGADEVDEHLNLIKGGGGALLREKIIAFSSKRFLVIIDESKLVKSLGKFPLPVEIIRFGNLATCRHLENFGCTVSLRLKNNMPFVTDNGNYIADCRFGNIPDPGLLQSRINNLPGVVENGLFIGKAERIIVGYADGQTREIVA